MEGVEFESDSGDGPEQKPGAGGAFQVEADELEILALADASILYRPCVDCGLRTGSFCDYCYAWDRDPAAYWAIGQHTPLCSLCDGEYNCCHFCRGQMWVVPPPHGPLSPWAGLHAQVTPLDR